MPLKSKAQRRKFAELLVTGKMAETLRRERPRAKLPERFHLKAAKRTRTTKRARNRRLVDDLSTLSRRIPWHVMVSDVRRRYGGSSPTRTDTGRRVRLRLDREAGRSRCVASRGQQIDFSSKAMVFRICSAWDESVRVCFAMGPAEFWGSVRMTPIGPELLGDLAASADGRDPSHDA